MINDDLISELDPNDRPLLNEVVNRLLKKITATTDYDIELQIHDLILKNVKYTDKKKTTEHTIEGVLLNKKAVCEGIAKTVKYLLNLKNIKSEIVIGKITKSPDTLHAWNIVFIDNNWYHLDVTSDLGLSTDTNYRYDYFNLSDEEISKDHIIIKSPAICSKSGYDYYSRNGLVTYNQKEYVDLLTTLLKKNYNMITIKIPYTKDVDNIEQLILERTKKAIRKSSKSIRFIKITSNKTQLVFTIEIEF